VGRWAWISGFPAIKLLTTVVVVDSATPLAVLALRGLVLNNRAVSRIHEFVAAVNLAHNEAARRGTLVTLCASASPQVTKPTYDGGERWGKGWILFPRTMTGMPS